jgi:hypothetical protein
MRKLPGFLTPAGVTTRPDPAKDPVGAIYVRSYLWMRLLVGVLGVALPPLVVFVEHYGYGGALFPRGSVSIYYYTGMRDVFVATIAATGIFFITYKIAEVNLDSTASTLAGLSAVLISQFPTGPPGQKPPVELTPLQDAIGVNAAKWIHYSASAVFLVGLTVLSFFFARREGKRKRRRTRLPRTFWRNLHFACTAAMAFALIWIVITSLAHGPTDSLLVGEWLAAWAFGISWFCKGAEWDMLFGTPTPEIDDEQDGGG